MNIRPPWVPTVYAFVLWNCWVNSHLKYVVITAGRLIYDSIRGNPSLRATYARCHKALQIIPFFCRYVMLSHYSGELLNVCKPVVFYLISFDILLPTTQVSLMPPRARCNSFSMTLHSTAQKPCGLHQQGTSGERRLQTSWWRAQKNNRNRGSGGHEEPVKLHIIEEQK